MRDYRQYTALYKYVGFFALIVAVFLIALRATEWIIWAHQCINAAS
jgi:uncharacterized membrane protein